jgi:hypothetical protein
VSLAQTGRFLSGLDRVEGGFACPDPKLSDIADLMEEAETPFGRLSYVRHAARLAETPARWDRPPAPLGSHAPVWPD